MEGNENHLRPTQTGALRWLGILAEFVLAFLITAGLRGLFEYFRMRFSSPFGNLAVLTMVFPMAGFALLYHRWRTRPKTGQIHLGGWRNLPHSFIGFAIGLSLGLLGLLAAHWINPHFSLQFADPRQIDWIQRTQIIAAAGGSSIWEEFLFRGIITVRLLHSGLSFHQASLLSVSVFTAMHFGVEPGFWLFFVFAAAYLLTGLLCFFGSIGAPLGCHFAFNFIRHMVNTETCVLAPNAHEHLPLLALVWSAAAGIAALPLLLFSRKRAAFLPNNLPSKPKQPRLLHSAGGKVGGD